MAGTIAYNRRASIPAQYTACQEFLTYASTAQSKGVAAQLSLSLSPSFFPLISLSLVLLVYYIRGTLRTVVLPAHVLEVNLFQGLPRRQRPDVPRFLGETIR